MKKRGQRPDAHTFTIIFRGLAERARLPLALAKAMTIYHSMTTPNSPVRPSIIHSNAVLKVAVVAGDMDAVWGIISKLPERGIGAPDTATWTLLLKALKDEATIRSEGGDESEGQKRARKIRAVIEGRKVWPGIIEAWKRGTVIVDEKAVASMAALLVAGERPEDIDDVFSLVQQTMNIPRQLPTRFWVPRGPLRISDEADDSDEVVDEVRDGGRGEGNGGEFEIPVLAQEEGTAPKRKTVRAIIFPTPGNGTLRALMDACCLLGNKQAGKSYWDLLTQRYKVKPDRITYNCYLRLLRIMRASTEATAVVQQMVQDDTQPLHHSSFRIAMSACRRDLLNKHSFTNACRLIELMHRHLPHPDPSTMHTFIDHAIRTDRAETIRAALRTLDPLLPWLRAVLAYDPDLDEPPVPASARARKPNPSPRHGEGARHERDPDTKLANEALNLARRMLGAYDILLNYGQRRTGPEWALDRTARQRYQAGQKTLNVWLARFTQRRSEDRSTRYRRLMAGDAGIDTAVDEDLSAAAIADDMLRAPVARTAHNASARAATLTQQRERNHYASYPSDQVFVPPVRGRKHAYYYPQGEGQSEDGAY